MYDALEEAYRDASQDAQAVDPNRLYSIVLMTDGETNRGDTADDFGFLARQPSRPRRETSRVYPILFGDANQDEMQRDRRPDRRAVVRCDVRCARHGVQADPRLPVIAGR